MATKGPHVLYVYDQTDISHLRRQVAKTELYTATPLGKSSQHTRYFPWFTRSGEKNRHDPSMNATAYNFSPITQPRLEAANTDTTQPHPKGSQANTARSMVLLDYPLEGKK